MKYLKVEFLNNYHAAGDAHKKQGEWPVSPFRMFCALIDAHYRLQRSGNNPNRNALLQLEKNQPCILTSYSEKNVERNYGRYVPGNERPYVRSYEKAKKAWPYQNALLHSPFVETKQIIFGWDVDEDVWEDIKSLFHAIDYIGISSSLVFVNEIVPNGFFKVWTPVNDVKCDFQLRSYNEGTLEKLDQKYINNTSDFFPFKQRYKTKVLNFKEGEIIKQTPQWAETYIVGIKTDSEFDICHSQVLSSCLRTALQEVANQKRMKMLVAEFASHEHKPHIAFSALPFVLGKWADGTIKGLMVSLPKELSHLRQDLGVCIKSLNEFSVYLQEHWKPYNIVIDGNVGKYESPLSAYDVGKVVLVEPKEIDGIRDVRSLSDDLWCGVSHVWTSVTPIEIKFHANNEQEIRKECERTGLAPPKKIEFKSVANRYCNVREFIFRKSTGKKNRGFLTHVTIEFEERVKGPILLGWGKNYGGGLFVRARG